MNRANDLPVLDDGRPRFRRCVVVVNGTAAQLAACEAIAGVEPLITTLSTENTVERALASLNQALYQDLKLAERVRTASHQVALAEANPDTSLIYQVRQGKDQGTLKDWVDSVFQQQRRLTAADYFIAHDWALP